MNDVTVVSNSGPLISLAAINQIDLLRKLFNKIFIPEAVYQEVVVHGENRPGQREVEMSDWIDVVFVSKSDIPKLMLDKLDPGESESLVLANELNADYLIIDEKLARRKALLLGLSCTGTLGVLLMAKKSNYIDNVAPFIDALQKASFRVSDYVKMAVLQEAGESVQST
jgi:hypothetical protein